MPTKINLLAIQVSRRAVKEEGEGILAALLTDVTLLVGEISECRHSDYASTASIADLTSGPDIIICVDDVTAFVPLLTNGELNPTLVERYYEAIQYCADAIANSYGLRTMLMVRTHPYTFSVTSA